MRVMRTCWCSAACPRIRSGCISRVDAVLPSEGDYQEKFQHGLWTLFWVSDTWHFLFVTLTLIYLQKEMNSCLYTEFILWQKVQHSAVVTLSCPNLLSQTDNEETKVTLEFKAIFVLHIKHREYWIPFSRQFWTGFFSKACFIAL